MSQNGTFILNYECSDMAIICDSSGALKRIPAIWWQKLFFLNILEIQPWEICCQYACLKTLDISPLRYVTVWDLHQFGWTCSLALSINFMYSFLLNVKMKLTRALLFYVEFSILFRPFHGVSTFGHMLIFSGMADA